MSPHFASTGWSPWVFGLREEARECWNHIVSDEIIYFAQPGNGKLKITSPFAKKYLAGSNWLLLQMTFAGYRNVVFVAVIEFSSPNIAHINREKDVDTKRVNRNGLVLVELRERLQMPK